MKAMVVFVVLLLGVVGLLAFCPAVRTRAEEVLFAGGGGKHLAGPPAHTGPKASAVAAAPSAAPTGTDSHGVTSKLRSAAESTGSALKSVGSGLADLVSSGPDAGPAPEQPAAPAAPEPVPAAAAQAAPPPAAPVVQANQMVLLPSGLSRARFGMTQAQIEGMYSIAWTKQQGGDLTLVHYPEPDKMQMVRFVVGENGLHRIEVRFKPGPGQTVGDVYEALQERYTVMYPNVAEKSRTRWSDGALALQVSKAATAAEAAYSPVGR